jgi:hypothetical protein
MDRHESDRRVAYVVTERLARDPHDTLRDAAHRAGISETTVRKITKERGLPGPDKLSALSVALGWRPDALEDVALGREDPKELLREWDSPGRAEHPPGMDSLSEAGDGAFRAQRPAEKASVDFLSGNEDATAEQLLEVLESVWPQADASQVGTLVEVIITRALDELVQGTDWSVGAARADWGADLYLSDGAGNERILVEAKSTPTQGFVPVNETIGRAVRSRARMSKTWDRPIDFWVVFTTDPGPQVITAFEDVDIPMGWVGHLPELPAGG